MEHLNMTPEAPARCLLRWYDQYARKLPFRDSRDPYHIFVSEMMLQQTRVETMIPYYLRFIERLPDVQALAGVSDAELMKLWEGLGYYSRARNLKKAAEMVVLEHGGALPGRFSALRALPGVGEYTAGAIASIAFGEAVPAVDGNVLRVVCRLRADRADVRKAQTKKDCQAFLRSMLPEDRPGDFNQAMMELGATVCLPANPQCGRCPVCGACGAYAKGIAQELPVRGAKKPSRVERCTVLILLHETEAFLMRRPPRGLLAGMWEFVRVPHTLSEAEAVHWLAERGVTANLRQLPDAKHQFTHIRWEMRAFCCTAAEKQTRLDGVWVAKKRILQEYALPSAYKTYLFLLK